MGWTTGFEPATTGITIRYSNQLSYAHRCRRILPNIARPDHPWLGSAPDRNRTCNRRLRRPMLYPVELRAQQLDCRKVLPYSCRSHRAHPAASAPALVDTTPLAQALCNGRGRGIRTPDILLPKQARYQTALHPEGEE